MKLDSKKEQLIHEFMELAKGKSMEELLPLLLAISQNAKQQGISFSKEELQYIISEAKSQMSDDQKGRLDMLLNMMNLS